MLGPLVFNRVGGEVHPTDIVAVDESAPGEGAVKLSRELSKPGGLRHTVGDGPVLHLGTGAGDHRLPLGRPRDEVAAQEDGVARRGPASVRAATPVGVGVDDEVSGGRSVEEQTIVNRATEVAEEPLQSSEEWLPGIMHVETDLLNGIGDVWPGEGKVLQGISQTPVVCRITNRGPSSLDSLPWVSTGVEQGLQSVIPARSRISRAYCRRWRKSPEGRGSTVTPKKWWSTPRSFIANSCSRDLMMF